MNPANYTQDSTANPAKPSRLACMLTVLTALALLSLLLAGSPAWAQETNAPTEEALAQKILNNLRRVSEQQRQFQTQARLLTKNSAEAAAEESELLLYVDRRAGQQRSLAKILAPQRSAGQIFLNNTAAYWVYYPHLQRSLALSPLSTLAGSVSIGDILAPPALQVYRAKVLQSSGEQVQIELQKSAPLAPYSRIVQHYQGEVLQNAEFYSGQKGDILIKQAQYSKPVRLGKDSFDTLYTQVKILDQLKQGAYSVIAFAPPKEVALPLSWFNPNNLQQVP